MTARRPARKPAARPAAKPAKPVPRQQSQAAPRQAAAAPVPPRVPGVAQVGQPAPLAPLVPATPPPPTTPKPRVKPNREAIARTARAVAAGEQETSTFGVGGYLGPSSPIAPRQPDGSEPRSFQYPPAYNIQVQPRIGEAVPFDILRAMAESSDYVRIAINHRKDQVRGIGWSITAINTEEAEAREEEVEAAREFWKSPDRDLDFSSWIDMVLEDVLVVDALTLFRRRTYGGEMFALEQVDGTTLKPLVDYNGRTPRPPLPAYQQYLYGRPDSQFTTDEMLYRPMRRRRQTPYGFSPVEAVLLKINMAMRRDMHTLVYFTEGNMPEAFLNLPKEWTQRQIKEFQDFFDQMQANVVARRRRIHMVPAESKYQEIKPFQFSREIDEWLAWIVAVAFGVSPMIFAKELPRANAEEEGNIQGDVGLQPLLLFLKGLFDFVLWDDLGFKDLHWTWTRDRAAKTPEQVKKAEAYVNTGIWSRDEVREREGFAARGGFAAQLVAFSPRLGIVPLEGQATTHEPDIDAAEEADEDLHPTRTVPKVPTREQQPGSGGQPSPEVSPRRRPAADIPVIKAAKITKSAADYIPAHDYGDKAEPCRRCIMFHPERIIKLASGKAVGTCDKVRGSIEPGAHCRFWHALAPAKTS